MPYKTYDGCTFTSGRAELSIKRILAALREQRMTMNKLAEAIHKSKTGTRLFLKYLKGNEEHGIPRRVRIAGWEETSGRPAPVYALGTAPDVPEPPRKTSSERHARLMADEERHQRLLAKRRALANSPRPRQTSLANRIDKYLTGNPNRTMRDIAEALHADQRIVTQNLQRLRKRGKAEITPGSENLRAPLWRLTGYVTKEITIDRRVVRQWKIQPIAKQNPFSALGI
jgi:DNA-binding MarR family transcriptional regulator